MTNTHNIEVFTAGCPLCDDALALVNEIAGADYEVTERDLHEEAALARARELGIRSVPAVVIDGEPADCCSDVGIEEAVLRAQLDSASGPKPNERRGRGCC